MFRMTSVGRPSARMGAASIRWRPRLVESSTSRMASGLGVSAPLAGEHVVRHLLVFRARRQAVDAGQVDQLDGAAVGQLGHAGVLLHRDAGKLATFWRRPVRRLNRVVLPELGGPITATALSVGCARREFNTGGAAAVAIAATAHRLLAARLSIWRDLQTPRGFAPQRDFRTIHLEHPRIAARGAESRRDPRARQKTQLHQAAGIVARQIDPVQDRRIAPAQVHQGCGGSVR